MTFNKIALLALAAFVCTAAAAEEKKEFPLVWVCLSVTVVGLLIAGYIAYRRPRGDLNLEDFEPFYKQYTKHLTEASSTEESQQAQKPVTV